MLAYIWREDKVKKERKKWNEKALKKRKEKKERIKRGHIHRVRVRDDKERKKERKNRNMNTRLAYLNKPYLVFMFITSTSFHLVFFRKKFSRSLKYLLSLWGQNQKKKSKQKHCKEKSKRKEKYSNSYSVKFSLDCHKKILNVRPMRMRLLTLVINEEGLVQWFLTESKNRKKRTPGCHNFPRLIFFYFATKKIRIWTSSNFLTAVK